MGTKGLFFPLKSAVLRQIPVGGEKCVLAAIPVGCAKKGVNGGKHIKTGPDTGKKGQKVPFFL